jgi:hypothetical protein
MNSNLQLCPFCHISAEYISGGKFSCNDCDPKMTLVFALDLSLEWIAFKYDPYQLHLDLRNNITYLYDDRFKIWEKPVLILNYLIAANPSNAKYWIDKLLKLKVFS